jgi:GT2 family glycosyltransferase
MSNSISVSIVLFKTPISDIKKCFDSLKTYAGFIKLHIVDNSPDDSLRFVHTWFPNTEYTHLPNNPGYGAAHNLAIRKFQNESFDFHLVINADVYFESDVLSRIIDYMNVNIRVGHIMPKVLYPNGDVQYLCKLIPTPLNLLFHRFFSSDHPLNRLFLFKNSGYDKVMFVPYLSGCFMFFRHSVLQEVGLFDERFFMYPEDIDLSRRIAEKYETIYYPVVEVYHNHGKASHQSFKMFLLHFKNLVKYFNKWGWFFDSKRTAINKKATTLLSES